MFLLRLEHLSTVPISPSFALRGTYTLKTAEHWNTVANEILLAK